MEKEISQEFADWLLSKWALDLLDLTESLAQGSQPLEEEVDKLRQLNLIPREWSDLLLERVKEIKELNV